MRLAWVVVRCSQVRNQCQVRQGAVQPPNHTMAEMPLVSLAGKVFKIMFASELAEESKVKEITLTLFRPGKSGLATDETTKETTANNTYSNVDTGSKGNTIADQLSSIATNTDSRT